MKLPEWKIIGSNAMKPVKISVLKLNFGSRKYNT